MVTRNAIIISCPDRRDNFLPGAISDAQSFRNFLLSPKGGSWYNHEILNFEEAQWLDCYDQITNTAADYQIIYFSGHGASDAGKRLLQFEDYLISDTQLLNNNPRQLIIVDACRNYFPTISGILESKDVYSSFSGDLPSRIIFDNHILNSPAGKLIVHATQDGEFARDAPYGRGGVFTIALLTSALLHQTEKEFTPISIEQLIPKATDLIKQWGYTQRPGIVLKNGNLTVPFMLDADQMEKAVPVITDKETSYAGLIGFGLLAFGLYPNVKRLIYRISIYRRYL